MCRGKFIQCDILWPLKCRYIVKQSLFARVLCQEKIMTSKWRNFITWRVWRLLAHLHAFTYSTQIKLIHLDSWSRTPQTPVFRLNVLWMISAPVGFGPSRSWDHSYRGSRRDARWTDSSTVWWAGSLWSEDRLHWHKQCNIKSVPHCKICQEGIILWHSSGSWWKPQLQTSGFSSTLLSVNETESRSWAWNKETQLSLWVSISGQTTSVANINETNHPSFDYQWQYCCSFVFLTRNEKS